MLAQMGFLHISTMAEMTSLIPDGFFCSFFFFCFMDSGVTFYTLDLLMVISNWPRIGSFSNIISDPASSPMVPIVIYEALQPTCCISNMVIDDSAMPTKFAPPRIEFAVVLFSGGK